MTKIFKILIVALSLTVVSCSEDPKPVNIICLIDYSSSVNKNTLQWYGAVIKEDIISALGQTDKLTVLPVDFGSQSGSKEIFSVDLENKKFTNMFDSPTRKDETIKRRVAQHVESLAPKFDSNFQMSISGREEYKHQTDIIGALKQADKYRIEEAHNLIIIFSDMQQETDDLNLPATLKKFKDYNPVIDKLNLPKLYPSDVLVITGEQPDYNSEYFNKLKTFWVLFFKKTGLNLLDFESAGRNFVSRQLSFYRKQDK